MEQIPPAARASQGDGLVCREHRCSYCYVPSPPSLSAWMLFFIPIHAFSHLSSSCSPASLSRFHSYSIYFLFLGLLLCQCLIFSSLSTLTHTWHLQYIISLRHQMRLTDRTAAAAAVLVKLEHPFFRVSLSLSCPLSYEPAAVAVFCGAEFHSWRQKRASEGELELLMDTELVMLLLGLGWPRPLYHIRLIQCLPPSFVYRCVDMVWYDNLRIMLMFMWAYTVIQSYPGVLECIFRQLDTSDGNRLLSTVCVRGFIIYHTVLKCYNVIFFSFRIN